MNIKKEIYTAALNIFIKEGVKAMLRLTEGNDAKRQAKAKQLDNLHLALTNLASYFGENATQCMDEYNQLMLANNFPTYTADDVKAALGLIYSVRDLVTYMKAMIIPTHNMEDRDRLLVSAKESIVEKAIYLMDLFGEELSGMIALCWISTDMLNEDSDYRDDLLPMILGMVSKDHPELPLFLRDFRNIIKIDEQKDLFDELRNAVDAVKSKV